MPPTTFTFTDLQAEVASRKQAQESGVPSATPIGGERKDKKKSDWLNQNKDVHKRAARDVELRNEEMGRMSQESIKANMEKKAKQYKQLKRGYAGGLNDAQLSEQPVDWDTKAEEDDRHFSSDSDDVDESATVSKPVNADDDPVIDYKDELGRDRSARKSEVPRQFLPKEKDDEDDEGFVINNAHHHYPTYEPSEERLKKIEESSKEEELEAHYDASQHIRDYGAGFYSFSRNKDQRARQRAELDRARVETKATRAEAGAVDVKPGIEGMQAEPKTSSAAEKRKRDTEERRERLRITRQKRTGTEDPKSSSSAPNTSPAGKSDKDALEERATAYLADLSAQLRRK